MKRKLTSLILSFTLSASMLINSSAVTVSTETSTDTGIGEIIELSLITADSNGFSARSNQVNDDRADIIEFMNAKGWLPGSTFYIGNKQYQVLDDYQIMYLGVDSDRIINHISDTARAINIPTTQGDIPYDGTYSILNYMYTSHYRKIGFPDTPESMCFMIAPDSSQTVRIDWMDGRNDEAMASHRCTGTSGEVISIIDWVYGGEKFYFKLTNEGSYGNNRITGAFTLEYYG